MNSTKNNIDKEMYRYRVRLLVDEVEWSTGHKLKNQIIALFKPGQTYKTDLSYMFSNYSEIDEDMKVYASSEADDYFSNNEIQELMDIFGMISEVQIMIHGRIKLPFFYSNGGGISIIPEDRRNGYISFKNTEKLSSPQKLSFPLRGLMSRDRHLIDPRDVEDILSKKDISNEKLKELLLEL